MSLERLKINDGRHIPGPGDGRLVVYSKYFNELVDFVATIQGTSGIGLFDIINEYTLGAGVTVDGLLLQDGHVYLSNDSVNEGRIYFDTDNDTFLTASNDNNLSFYSNGNYTFLANAGGISMQGGADLDLNNDTLGLGQLQFDLDGDTYLSTSADDTLQMYVGAANTWTYTATGSNALVAVTLTAGALTDTLSELTGGVGVTIDGVLLQDGHLDLNSDAVGSGQAIFDADGDTYISAIADDILSVFCSSSEIMQYSTANILANRALIGNNAITSTSATGGLGYATGAGDAQTQATSAITTVVSNAVCGQITTFALANLAGVDHSFTLTNSTIAATDTVVVSIGTYGGTADGIPVASVVATAAGSCVINIRNTGAIALDALAVINFSVIKAVAS